MDGSRLSQSQELKKAEKIANTSKLSERGIWLSQHEKEAQAIQLRKQQEVDTSFKIYNSKCDIQEELNSQSSFALTEYITYQHGLNSDMQFEVQQRMVMTHDLVTKQTQVMGQQPHGPWEKYSFKGKGE